MPSQSSFGKAIATSGVHDNRNPLWKGPCADGPLGGITQSMIVRFLSCRERFRLKYILGLDLPDKWSKNTGYGNMWHTCEEAFANGEPHNKMLLSHTNQQIKRYQNQSEEIEKWYNVCKIQFPEYIKYWAEHPDVTNRKPLVQEHVFDIPYTLPCGWIVRLRGKFDSVDVINDGIWLQENKTKGDIDKIQLERQLRFDLQTMLYIIALEETIKLHSIGIPDGIVLPSVRGVRYNVVRRPLSGGVGTIRPHAAKSTKTKFTPAETSSQFYERLRKDYIAADPDHWFFRLKIDISKRDIEVFKNEFLNPILEQLCWWYADVTGKIGAHTQNYFPKLNYRTPFGVWSALEEGGSTEYDAYFDTGSEIGLRRTKELFTELQ